MSTWVIQQKLFKGDWETVAASDKRTKAEALEPYSHMNGKLRAVSRAQAWRDYEAGRADDYERKLELEELKRKKCNNAIRSQVHAMSAHEQNLLPEEFTYEMEKTDADYKRYLERRGITAEQHEREVGEWLDVQD